MFLGVARYRLNDYPAAITALRKETQIDAGNGKALMWLGVAQLAAGDNAAAAASLDKAAQLNPSDVDILYHRGRAHMLGFERQLRGNVQGGPELVAGAPGAGAIVRRGRPTGGRGSRMPKCAEFAPPGAGAARRTGRHLLESESTGESGSSLSGGVESRSGEHLVHVQAGGSEPRALQA